MKANKDFDMLFVPNMFHGEGGNLYLLRRRWDYFVRVSSWELAIAAEGFCNSASCASGAIKVRAASPSAGRFGKWRSAGLELPLTEIRIPAPRPHLP